MNPISRRGARCSRTVSSSRLTLLVLLLAVLASTAASTGCGDEVAYTYVSVRVTIDRETVSATQLYLVTSCEFQVRGAEITDAFNIRCPENNVPYDVGVFQWTSRAKSGSLQFLVQIFDGNHALIGEGTNEAVTVSPGKALQTSVLVLGVSPPDGPDGGADASTPMDGAVPVDVNTGNDGATGPDAVDGAPADVNADAPVEMTASGSDGGVDMAAGSDSGADMAAAIDAAVD